MKYCFFNVIKLIVNMGLKRREFLKVNNIIGIFCGGEVYYLNYGIIRVKFT